MIRFQPLSRGALIAAVEGMSVRARFSWCNSRVRRTVHRISDQAGEDYQLLGMFLAKGIDIESIRKSLPKLTFKGEPITEDDYLRYTEVNALIRESHLARLLDNVPPDQLNVFKIVSVGLNTLRNFSLALLNLLPQSFELQIQRPIQLCEWDVLSWDLLRAVKSIALTHGDILEYFRGAPNEDDRDFPIIAVRPSDLEIGRRNGLLKVEIGARPFQLAYEELKDARIDPRLGCAGHLAIPAMYRWIRRIVRDLVAEPTLREFDT